jgi:iron complex outermembrane receptor protein
MANRIIRAALAGSVSMLALGSAAHAQTTDTPAPADSTTQLGTAAATSQDTAPAASAEPGASVEEKAATDIVVTGIRQSLRSNVQIKRNTMEIVDSITAEDIGKLPDPNVAETLSRIPGVQAYRYGGEGASPVGEGSGITIRGLTGQTASHLDGRAYFTAGGREFNIEGAIPGMIAGVDVFKNPSAKHIEGGIGGIINVRTRKPLDFKRLTVSAAVSARYNDLSEKLSPEVFGLIADRWDVGDGGEMGFMVAANFQESNNRSDSIPALRGPQTRRAIRADSTEYLTATRLDANGNVVRLYDSAFDGRTDVSFLADVNYAALPEAERANLIASTGTGGQVFQEDIHRVRKGANVAFQWKPNPGLEFYAQGNYNYYLYDQSYRFIITGESRYAQNLVTSPFSIDEDLMNRNLNGGDNELVSGQRIDSATFLNSSLFTLGGREERPYETWLAAVGANWQATERLNARLDLSYIKADQSRLNHNVRMNPAAGRSWDISRDLTTTPHSIAFSGPSLSDPANFVFDSYNTDANEIWDDNGLAGQLDLNYNLDSPFLTAIKAGARYATQKSRYYNYRDGGRSLGALPVTQAQDLTDLAPTNWLDGRAGYTGGYIVFDPDGHFGDNVRNRFPAAGIPAANSMPEQLVNRRFSQEESYAGYVMGEFAYNDLIKGNIGVRLVKSDLFARSMVQTYQEDANGNVVLDANGRPIPAAIVPNEGSNSYVDVLPSFNIVGSITKDTLLRFGYAKAITRPSLGALNPSISLDTVRGVASAGNPELAPLKADSFDLSLEHYFSPVSYVSVGVFYKSLKGFPFGREQCASIPLAPTPVDTDCADPTQYKLTIADNAEKGHAKGLEIAGQAFFEFLPGILKNFGAAGSFAYLKTKNPVSMPQIGLVNTPMPFQSKYAWSASGMYEDKFMSARLVYTYRSDFALFGIDPWPIWGRYAKGYGILDGAVNFNLPYDFTLSFTASNITNNAPHRNSGEPGPYATDFQTQHFVNGRIFGAGLRWKFGG